jgi:predicted dehydrogenase
MTVNIGVIGIGYGQHVLLPVFQMDPRTTVHAVCASTAERAHEVADAHGVPKAYGDWHDLIADPQIDAVAVATPPAIQPQIAIAAANAGKHLFLEKPLALSVTDAEAVVNAVTRAGVVHTMDFEFPEMHTWRKARELLTSGSVGALRHIEAAWNVETYANRHHLTNWKTSADGGTLYSFVSHVFYNLEWLTGGRVVRLAARLGKAPQDTRTGDTVNLLHVEMAGGLLVSITVSSHAFMGGGHRWTFYGDDGTLLLENPTRDYIHGFTLRRALRATGILQDVTTMLEDYTVDGRRLMAGRVADRFLDAISNGGNATPDAHDGLRVQRLIALAQQSDAAGQWVDAV